MPDLISISKGLLHLILQITTHLFHFLQAVARVNYQVITTVFRILNEGCKALFTILIALGSAVSDIFCHIAQFICEIAKLLYVFIGHAGTLALLFCEFCVLVIEQAFILLKWGFHYASDALIWIYSSAVDCLAFLWSSRAVAKEAIVDVTTQTVDQVTTLSYSVQQTLPSKSSLWQTLDNTWHGLLNIKDVISDACTYSVFDFFNSLSHVYNKLSDKIVHGISTDVYYKLVLAITLASIGLLAIKVISNYFSTHGLTFPGFSLSDSNHQIELRELENTNMYIFDSSEEELEEGETEDDDEEHIAIEELEDNGEWNEDDDTADDESTQDEEQSDENDSGQEEEEEEEDDNNDFDVDEYEPPDSDEEESGDENDQNAINVQLPARTGHYALRERTSLTPVPGNYSGNTPVSPDQLEKVLEYERDKRMCVVCQDQVKCVLVLPCRHMCLCVECAHEIVSSRLQVRRVCPLCRGPIETIMNIYV